jgi:hypothetical protein
MSQFLRMREHRAAVDAVAAADIISMKTLRGSRAILREGEK